MPETSLLTLALGAGLLAAVNPCGFALLPAYLSLLVVGDQPEDRTGALLRALRLTAAMTLGFAGVFAVFGLAIAPVAPQIQGDLPWVTLGLGLMLAVLGAYLLTGRSLRLPRLGRTRQAKPLTGSFASMAGFGAGYATTPPGWVWSSARSPSPRRWPATPSSVGYAAAAAGCRG